MGPSLDGSGPTPRGPRPPIPPKPPFAHAHTARAPRFPPRTETHTRTHAPSPAKTQVLDGTAFSLLEFYRVDSAV